MMKGIFFRSSMGGGSGFETLMIEEKEGVGGGALVRPKFVPTLHIGLKFGKVSYMLVFGNDFLKISFTSLDHTFSVHLFYLLYIKETGNLPKYCTFCGFFKSSVLVLIT